MICEFFWITSVKLLLDFQTAAHSYSVTECRRRMVTFPVFLLELYAEQRTFCTACYNPTSGPVVRYLICIIHTYMYFVNRRNCENKTSFFVVEINLQTQMERRMFLNLNVEYLNFSFFQMIIFPCFTFILSV